MYDPIPKEEWENLPESAQVAVRHFVRLLLKRLSGKISFDCQNGGIGSIGRERTTTRNADGSRNVEVRKYQPRDISNEM